MKLICLLLFSCPFFASAQDRSLLVEGSSPSLYLNHVVVPKENFYSIGRLYNISPKEIAQANKIQMEKGLNAGQMIKVPLSATNFEQGEKVAADEALIPVYYSVKDNEGLYRIGINHNKLPVETLKKWNDLKKDDISKGTKLLIGYLRVKKDLSAFANNVPAVKPVQAVVKTEDKKPVIVTPEKPVNKTDIIPPVKNTDKEKTVVKETDKIPAPIKEIVPNTIPVTNPVAVDFKGGVFRNLFDSQVSGNAAVQTEGLAGVFKSTSGWNDGKYYCLLNDAAAGTIIKITNTATGKFIYAKVLDVMPDIKQNNGLIIRVSNAAASELGAGENNFNCSINYSK